MTTTLERFASVPAARPMLRWVFSRGGLTLTCELDAGVRHTFDVSLIPHWDVSGSVVERFGDAIRAMERHAAIARALRHSGWVLVDHVAPDYARAA